MISRIHQKLGTAGFIISIVALVAALGGGAYAASAKLNSTQKKEVTKIAQTEAKKFAGKTGATGPAGPAGAAGAKGDTGPKGDTGAQGDPGTPGAAGAPGAPGAAGKEGSPWTAGGTLPSGKTETGVWSFGYTPAGGTSEQFVPISFPIQLSAGVTSVHFLNWGAAPTAECPGDATDPLAAKGNLCVYSTENFEAESGTYSFGSALNPEKSGGPAAGATGKTGAVLYFNHVAEEELARGVWAVTAP
jgi:Collagen triple helix repeat (20 copies)